MLCRGLIHYVLQNQNNSVNEAYHKLINDDGRIHLVPSKAKDVYFLRYAIVSAMMESSDVQYGFRVLQELAGKILAQQ